MLYAQFKAKYKPYITSSYCKLAPAGMALRRLPQRGSSWIDTRFFDLHRALLRLPSNLHYGSVWIPRASVQAHFPASVFYGMERRFVHEGDWDLEYCLNMERHPSDQQLVVEEVVLKGKPFEATNLFPTFQERLEKGEYVRGLSQIEEVESRYIQPLKRLMSEIDKNGFKTAAQLRAIGIYGASDIQLLINRHGAPLLLGGKHRFAISCCLGIKSIPVQIVGAHIAWAQECCKKFPGSAWSAITKGIQSLPAALASQA